MPRTLRRLVAVCSLALVVAGLAATPSTSVAAPRASVVAQAPSVPAPAGPGRAYPGYVAGGGNLGLVLSNTADGRIKLTWKAPASTKLIKRWALRTSTSRDLVQHARTYRFPARARSAVVDHADLVTSPSGSYTFVQLTIVRRLPRGMVGKSPTKWIKAPVTATPAGASSVAVGTFNVRSWNLDSPADRYSWNSRKPYVYRTILNSGAGVVAIQEASGSDDQGYGAERQWTALVDGLNRTEGGQRWALTNSEPYKSAVRKPSGRQGSRIVYDASQYELLDQGVADFNGATSSDICWIPWAHFRQRATGLQFFFVSAHLATGNDARGRGTYPMWALRNTQATQIIGLVGTLRAAYPAEQAVVAGDMNSTIYTPPDNGVQRTFLAAGYYDAFASNDISAGEYPTTNEFEWPVPLSPHRRDYIFSVGPLAGSYWYRNLAYRTQASGVASDHFMQVALLPIG